MNNAIHRLMEWNEGGEASQFPLGYGPDTLDFQQDLRAALDAAAERDALRKALGKIADQMGRSEMSYADGRHADFEGAYDTMIDIARAALATNPTGEA